MNNASSIALRAADGHCWHLRRQRFAHMSAFADIRNTYSAAFCVRTCSMTIEIYRHSLHFIAKPLGADISRGCWLFSATAVPRLRHYLPSIPRRRQCFHAFYMSADDYL